MDQASNGKAQVLHVRSFQVLSCVAPLIWIKLVSSMMYANSVQS